MSETGMPFRLNSLETVLKPVSKQFRNSVKTGSRITLFLNSVQTSLKPVSTLFIARIGMPECHFLTSLPVCLDKYSLCSSFYLL